MLLRADSAALSAANLPHQATTCMSQPRLAALLAAPVTAFAEIVETGPRATLRSEKGARKHTFSFLDEATFFFFRIKPRKGRVRGGPCRQHGRAR